MLRGKLEFATGEEGREAEILEHLLRRATADTARARLRGLDLTPLAEAVSQVAGAHGGAGARRQVVVSALPTGGRADRDRPAARRGAAPRTPARWPSAAELALELLFLTRKLAKDEATTTRSRYG